MILSFDKKSNESPSIQMNFYFGTIFNIGSFSKYLEREYSTFSKYKYFSYLMYVRKFHTLSWTLFLKENLLKLYFEAYTKHKKFFKYSLILSLLWDDEFVSLVLMKAETLPLES